MAITKLASCNSRILGQLCAIKRIRFLFAFFIALSASALNAQQIAVVTHNGVVRERPMAGARPIDRPPLGERLIVLEERLLNGFYHVRLPSGQVGWLYRTFVRLEPSSPPIDSPALHGRMVAHFIDVDQGAAALLEFSCAAILIDAGGYGTPARIHLVEYLEAFFQRRSDLNRTISAVFVTHHHDDHDAHLRRLQPFRVGGFIYNGHSDRRIDTMIIRAQTGAAPFPVFAATDQNIPLTGNEGLTNGVIDPVDCPDVDPAIRVLSGGRTTNPDWRRAEYAQPNNHSLVIRIDFGRASFLFTGDLETPGIEALLARYQGTSALDVQVYAVGHHGADNGTTPDMLRAITPEVAVISVGMPSETRGRTAFGYGHPRLETVNILEAWIARPRQPVEIMTSERGNGAFSPQTVRHAIYATSRDGDIDIIALADGTLQVRTGR